MELKNQDLYHFIISSDSTKLYKCMDVPIYTSDCCSLESGGLRPATWPWAVELERGRIDSQTEDIFTNKIVQNG